MTKATLNAMAVATMALVLAALAFTLWSGNQRNAATGPASISQDGDKRVWLLADRRLFILDAEGKVLRASPLTELGMDDSVDTLAARPSGGAVAGSHEKGLLYVLDESANVVRTIDPGAAMRGLRNGFSLHATASWILVAHTGRHALFALDESGSVLHQAGSLDGKPSDFHFPNNISVGEDGLIYVADTNHHEIEVLNEDLKRVRAPIPVAAVDGASWPVAAVRLPTGNLAVSILRNGMRHGAVALVDERGRRVRKLELQDGAEPLELLVRETELLVCDQHDARFQVRRFDHDGSYAGEFGDAAFLRAMREAGARHRLYSTLRTVGQVTALLAAVLLLLIYRRAREVEDEASPVQVSLPPQRGAVTPSDQGAFYFAVGWPIALATIVVFGATWVKLPPGQAVIVLSLSLVVLFWAVQRAARNVQHPRFDSVVQAQLDKQLRRRLKSLGSWGSQEPVLATGRAIYKGKGVFVLISPVRVVILPILMGEAMETVPLKSIAGIAQVTPAWNARFIGGKLARGMQLQLLEPQARELSVSFMAVAEHDRVVQALLQARQLSSGGAAARALPDPELRPARPAWSSLLLSALLPGLGHFNQRRNDEGTLWLGVFGALVVINGLEWFVHTQRIAEVPVAAMLSTSAMLVLGWAMALHSVWRYEQQRNARPP